VFSAPTHSLCIPLGLIILGIVLDLGGGPNHDRLGFRYWKNPGPFVQYHGISGAKGRFLGWWAVMTQAAFSFVCYPSFYNVETKKENRMMYVDWDRDRRCPC
jgi:amino acid permease